MGSSSSSDRLYSMQSLAIGTLLLLLLIAEGSAFSTVSRFAASRTRQSASARTTHHYHPPLQQRPSCLSVTSTDAATAVDATAAPSYYDDDDEGVLDVLEDDEDANAETYHINLELARLAYACAKDSRQSRTLALEAYDLLQHNMTHPDTVAYNSVLKAFAKASPKKFPPPPSNNPDNAHLQWVTAAERAQHLLDEMMTLNDAQTAANQEWYIRRQDDTLGDEELAQGPPKIRVKPNVRSFSTVMDAWSRTGQVTETLRVLQALEDRYEATGRDRALQPNSFSYNTVLAAYAKSRGGQAAAEAAQDFLQETMEDNVNVEPDVVSYNALLVCWARSGVPQAGAMAEAILRKMSDLGVEPNTKSYSTCMDAWSRSARTDESAAARAHGLLLELQQRFDETGDESLRPNCISYSSVIHAYAVSPKEPQKAQRAFALLEEMKVKGRNDPHVLPNTVTYNSVLNACATSSPFLSSSSSSGDTSSSTSKTKVSLQDIVQSLYQELIGDGTDEKEKDKSNNNKVYRKKLIPDHFTFGTVLKACANNIFWDDPTFGMYVFQEARRRGQVSLGVLVQLRQAVPVHVLCDFLPPTAYDRKTRQFNMAEIPKAWTRNVRERSKK